MVLFESVWIHHGCCSKARSEESNPFAWRTGKSRVEREQPLLVNVGRCWSLLVVLFRCSPSRFQPFRLEKIPTLVPLDISGPFWAQGGSRCAETTSAPVTNKFEETLRRSGARAKGTGTWWFFSFCFFGWPAGSPRCSNPPKIYGA